MAKFLTKVGIVTDDPEQTLHLNEEIDVANFAAVLSHASVTGAVSDAQAEDDEATVYVKSWLRYDEDVEDSPYERAGARYYIPSTIELYNERSEKVTSLAVDIAAGETQVASDWDGFNNIYYTTPAIQNGHTQAISSNSDITTMTFVLESDEQDLELPIADGEAVTDPVTMREVQSATGAGSWTSGQPIQGRIRLVASATTIAGDTSYRYLASGNVDIPVDFVVK